MAKVKPILTATGTLGGGLSSKIRFGHKYADKFTTPIISGYVEEYLSDSDRIKNNLKNIGGNVHETE